MNNTEIMGSKSCMLKKLINISTERTPNSSTENNNNDNNNRIEQAETANYTKEKIITVVANQLQVTRQVVQRRQGCHRHRLAQSNRLRLRESNRGGR